MDCIYVCICPKWIYGAGNKSKRAQICRILMLVASVFSGDLNDRNKGIRRIDGPILLTFSNCAAHQTALEKFLRPRKKQQKDKLPVVYHKLTLTFTATSRFTCIRTNPPTPYQSNHVQRVSGLQARGGRLYRRFGSLKNLRTLLRILSIDQYDDATFSAFKST